MREWVRHNLYLRQWCKSKLQSETVGHKKYQFLHNRALSFNLAVALYWMDIDFLIQLLEQSCFLKCFLNKHIFLGDRIVFFLWNHLHWALQQVCIEFTFLWGEEAKYTYEIFIISLIRKSFIRFLNIWRGLLKSVIHQSWLVILALALDSSESTWPSIHYQL